MFADRLPPNSREAEQSVLGAALISRAAVETMLSLLEREDFYHEAHRKVFDAIAAQSAQERPVDLVTTCDELERRGQLEAVGGRSYMSLLSQLEFTGAFAERYARLVAEKSTRRKLISAAGEVTALAYDECQETDTVVSLAEQRVMAARPSRNLAEWRSQGLAASDALGRILNRENIRGVTTGLSELDHKLKRLKPGNLVVVAARPSVGKTALALHLARAAAGEGSACPTAFFSLEMSEEELTHRQLAHVARINSLRVDAEDHTDAESEALARAAGLLGELPIEINDQSELDIEGIRALARRWRKGHAGPGVILIDYLQRIAWPAKAQNENHALETIAKGCKSMSRELGVCVVVLSQLSRNLERREDKRPMLSDLRGSGGIEQEADVVLTLYRPDYHRDEEDEQPREQRWPQRVEIGLPKNRNGPAGISVTVMYNAPYGDFTGVDYRHGDDQAPSERRVFP